MLRSHVGEKMELNMVTTKITAMDMQQAVESISKEYGPDALLLDTRKVKRGGFLNLFSKSYYEVLVGYEPEKTPARLKRQAQAAPQTQAAAAPPPGLNPELCRRMIYSPPAVPAYDDWANSAQERELAAVAGGLVSCRVSEQYARQVTSQAADILETGLERDAKSAVCRVLRGSLKSAAPLEDEQKAVLFIGPTGAGKTSSLLKLAAGYRKEGKSVGIVNADAYKISACEHMHLYADILDLPIKTIYSADELEPALAELSGMDVILIDTAGKGPLDPEHRRSVQKMARHPLVKEIFLTLSAPTCFSSSKEIIDSYSHLDDYKLLVTKNDETALHGNILNLCLYSGRGLTYMTHGQNIPGDIEAADTGKLALRIMEECAALME